MKCSQCGNVEFFSTNKSGFGGYSGDCNFRADEHRNPLPFICTQCGHVEWFDDGPGKRLHELIDIIARVETNLNAQKEILKEIQAKVDVYQNELTRLLGVIGNEENSLKLIKESKEQFSQTKQELSHFQKQSGYYRNQEIFDRLQDNLKQAKAELIRFQTTYLIVK